MNKNKGNYIKDRRFSHSVPTINKYNKNKQKKFKEWLDLLNKDLTHLSKQELQVLYDIAENITNVYCLAPTDHELFLSNISVQYGYLLCIQTLMDIIQLGGSLDNSSGINNPINLN